MRALADLHDRAIHWPAPSEQCQASDWVEAQSCRGWRPGYAMVDGTLIPLAVRPVCFGNLFFDRKMNYSLGLQVMLYYTSPSHFLIPTLFQLIMSPSLKIWDYVLGLPGSTHDSEVFKQSYTFANHDTLFPHGQWIWADSAYPLLDWCITPYKEPDVSEPSNAQFNYHLSRVSFIDFIMLMPPVLTISCQVRIRSEHAVGALKGRFQCLKGL